MVAPVLELSKAVHATAKSVPTFVRSGPDVDIIVALTIDLDFAAL